MLAGWLLAALTALYPAPHPQSAPTPLDRFLARGEEPTVEYRALRTLEARNPKFNQQAWMIAWTEYDRVNGFRYQIVGEGGSGYIRSHVLRAALEGEQKMWASRQPQKASLTPENYTFDNDTPDTDGLAAVGVKAKRKDVLLVDGAIYVQPVDGDLTRIEGRLSKTPSFWTRRVDIVRRYDRIAGVRVPISIESVAHVLIAGRSTFAMTYQYETINGQHVGSPKPPSPSF
jgi:hypothetical protein